jgi:ATP-dependent Clp protease ATP-binding subunit ClpA
MFERFTLDTRAAVVLAQEEAREWGGQIGPQHLLLGVLRAAGPELSAVLGGTGLTADAVRARLVENCAAADNAFDDDAHALSAIGIDLRAVRDAVSRTFGADAFDNALRRSGRRSRRRGHMPFTRAAKKALELALREALAHKDKEIRCEHVVLGILRGGDQAAIDLIAERVDTAQLRAAITERLSKAA